MEVEAILSGPAPKKLKIRVGRGQKTADQSMYDLQSSCTGPLPPQPPLHLHPLLPVQSNWQPEHFPPRLKIKEMFSKQIEQYLWKGQGS